MVFLPLKPPDVKENELILYFQVGFNALARAGVQLKAGRIDRI